MDYTNEFDRRLEEVRKGSARGHVLAHNEADAAAATYERVKTAAAICAVLVPNASAAEIVSLARELGTEARHRQSGTGIE